jgi:hypothetical protein
VRHRRTVPLSLIGQVGGNHLGPLRGHALLQQQPTGLVQLFRGAREQDHVGTRNIQPERDGLANATPGPGNQRGLAAKQLPLLLLHD